MFRIIKCNIISPRSYKGYNQVISCLNGYYNPKKVTYYLRTLRSQRLLCVCPSETAPTNPISFAVARRRLTLLIIFRMSPICYWLMTVSCSRARALYPERSGSGVLNWTGAADPDDVAVVHPKLSDVDSTTMSSWAGLMLLMT